MLKGLSRGYHASLAALGQQHPEVTKQPLVSDLSATHSLASGFACHYTSIGVLSGWLFMHSCSVLGSHYVFIYMHTLKKAPFSCTEEGSLKLN